MLKPHHTPHHLTLRGGGGGTTKPSHIAGAANSKPRASSAGHVSANKSVVVNGVHTTVISSSSALHQNPSHLQTTHLLHVNAVQPSLIYPQPVHQSAPATANSATGPALLCVYVNRPSSIKILLLHLAICPNLIRLFLLCFIKPY